MNTLFFTQNEINLITPYLNVELKTEAKEFITKFREIKNMSLIDFINNQRLKLSESIISGDNKIKEFTLTVLASAYKENLEIIKNEKVKKHGNLFDMEPVLTVFGGDYNLAATTIKNELADSILNENDSKKESCVNELKELYHLRRLELEDRSITQKANIYFTYMQ